MLCLTCSFKTFCLSFIIATDFLSFILRAMSTCLWPLQWHILYIIYFASCSASLPSVAADLIKNIFCFFGLCGSGSHISWCIGRGYFLPLGIRVVHKDKTLFFHLFLLSFLPLHFAFSLYFAVRYSLPCFLRGFLQWGGGGGGVHSQQWEQSPQPWRRLYCPRWDGPSSHGQWLHI